MLKHDYTKIERANWQNHQNLLRSVRQSVFIEEQKVPVALEWDGLDATAVHLLAFRDAQAIGCARILDTGQIGRMAVLPEWRKKGVASLLLEQALQITLEEIGKQPFLFAQTNVISLYEKAGFKTTGEIFLEANIPHIRMDYLPDR